MKRHWLANFWCSWMVEKTDSTRQLKTRRNLERESVSMGVGAIPVCSAGPYSQPVPTPPPKMRPPQLWLSHRGHGLPLDGGMEQFGSPRAAARGCRGRAVPKACPRHRDAHGGTPMAVPLRSPCIPPAHLGWALCPPSAMAPSVAWCPPNPVPRENIAPTGPPCDGDQSCMAPVCQPRLVAQRVPGQPHRHHGGGPSSSGRGALPQPHSLFPEQNNP